MNQTICLYTHPTCIRILDICSFIGLYIYRHVLIMLQIVLSHPMSKDLLILFQITARWRQEDPVAANMAAEEPPVEASKALGVL